MGARHPYRADIRFYRPYCSRNRIRFALDIDVKISLALKSVLYIQSDIFPLAR